MSADKLTWYVARSGGIVAWSLLALSLIFGLVLSSRVLGRRASPAWTLAVHRFLGGMAVTFTAVHVVAIMLDDYVDFGLAEVSVPFASSWRPGAVAWGIVAMYVLIAVEGTSLLMRWLPRRLWRQVHWTSSVLFVTATVHGFQAGTDAGRRFIMATCVVVIALAALTTIRVLRARNPSSPGPRAGGLVRPPRSKPLRPSPPRHVLDHLTLASRPEPGCGARTPTAPPSLTEALPEVPDDPAGAVVTEGPAPNGARARFSPTRR